LDVAGESRLPLESQPAASPLLEGARSLALGFQAGGLKANRRQFEPRVEARGAFDEVLHVLLYDPQTSGGLFLLVPPENLAGLLAERPEACTIGRAVPAGPSPIVLVD